jgi:hypothetical protein
VAAEEPGRALSDFLELVVQLPEDSRRVVLDGISRMRAMRWERRLAQELEAIRAPAAVHAPTILYDLPAPPPRTRQDLILSALVIVYVCLAYVCVTTRPLPEAMIEPLAGALGLLAWVYDRHTNP